METVLDREREFTLTTQRPPHKTFKRPLEPVDRISEVWFGLMMVLTFTCSISVTEAGLEEVSTMLIAAITCNLAWGIIDGFMYLLACFVEQGHSISALRAVRQASDPGVAHRMIAKAMPPMLASVMSHGAFEEIRTKLNRLPEPPARPKLSKEDWLGSIAVFLAVFLSTFPVVIPFLVIGDAGLALRISNGIAVVMLFLSGYAFGRYAGYRPWRMGLWMAIVGSALVALTIVLGG
jgi:VIT family